MEEKKFFVIDFDSTFTQVEALDVLCEVSLEGKPEKEEVLQKIKDITDKGMEGGISFRESLKRRLELLQAHRSHLPALIGRLRNQVTRSVMRNREFFENHRDRIYIISNGFREFIVPVVSEHGVKPENVYANNFTFDEKGNITGFDEANILSQNNGKPAQIKALNLDGEVYVIGDGYTDYEIKAAGLASRFYAFTENVTRAKVTKMADHITPSFDEFLYHNKMNTTLSYPKNRIKVLLLENIHPKAIDILREEGYQVEVYGAGLDEDELVERIKDVSILGIRSKTQVTKKVLESARHLIAVGAYCIGTNQIDLETATKKGVAVFNAPFSNTRSVVELAIGEMILLIRNLPDKISRMHEGKWNKSASGSFEIRGKKLGIVGYGNIGSQLSVLAEAMGMKVYFYDVEEKLALSNATKCGSLDELLAISDVVSLHVDGRKSNKNLIGREEFAKMKDGAILLNLSRGHIVDIRALHDAIVSEKVRGCSVDVFPYEPISNNEEFVSELRGLPNTILTPHIGGSTLEAQENIATYVPNKIIDYINSGSTSGSVNLPNVTLPHLQQAHRFLHIHENIPGVMAKINQVFAIHEINVVGQYLKTSETIGYVIADIDKEYDKQVMTDLKAIEGTIRFRVLY